MNELRAVSESGANRSAQARRWTKSCGGVDDYGPSLNPGAVIRTTAVVLDIERILLFRE